MQQLECPRDRNVVSNVAREVMRNRQNRATGTSEIGTKRTSRSHPLRSAFRGKAENIRSKRVFRLLTHLRHQRAFLL
jgi:hypothetical protein